MKEVLMSKEEIRQIINECVAELIGDTPVPYQLAVALVGHEHEQYALAEEVKDIKKEVERLYSLVGDSSVAEQINAAFNG